MLPTGKVLVVGGSGYADNQRDSLTVLQPEIWDPDYNGGQGQWSGDGVLAKHAIHRDYHSTAILLPDGRVLIAGGNQDGVNAKYAEIFCPPYLFNSSGGLLARPRIDCAPTALNYGQCFKVCTPQAATISSACLIRPAAVTHGFDQNQRYVPLSISATTGPARLQVTAPASAVDAPPGYYLLFIVDGANSNSVPSVARWVRLDSTSASCDSVVPGGVSDLAAEFIAQHSIGLSWTAPGDDGGTGTATAYDVRYSGSAITSESSFNGASPAQDEPAPQEAGNGESFELTGLAACTNYYFRMRTYDELCNTSGLSNDPGKTRTLCSGGGGGASAQQVHGDTEGGTGTIVVSTTTRASTLKRAPIGGAAPGSGSMQPAPLLARTHEAATLKPSSGTLVVGTTRTADGGWQIKVTSAESSEGSDLPDGAALTIQDREGGTAWRTRSRYESAAAEDVVGLSALHDRGRAVLPGGYGLQRVIGAIRCGGSTCALTAASHSSLGTLDVAAIASGDAISLTVGDTLSLTYAPDSSVAASAEDWYLIAGRGLLMTATRQQPVASETMALPLRFALHQNQPNPFSAHTTIRFDLPSGAMVRLEVFDVSGRRVKVLAHHYYPPGYQAIEWDQRNDAGGRVGPGVYFYRIEAGPLRDRKKMALTP